MDSCLLPVMGWGQPTRVSQPSALGTSVVGLLSFNTGLGGPCSDASQSSYQGWHLGSDGIRLPLPAMVGTCRGLSDVGARRLSSLWWKEWFAKEVLAGLKLGPLNFWAS